MYPRPHDMFCSSYLDIDNAAVKNCTIYPILFYDEALGAPSAYESNPEHTSFAEVTSGNCYPRSRVNKQFAELRCSISASAIITDKIEKLRYAVMPIFMSFKENYEAIDELSTHEVQDVLHLQKESTDKQGGPLYDGTKLVEFGSGLGTQPASHPFLTTTQVNENVAFDPNVFYDTLQYKTNAGKLKASCGKLSWHTINKFQIKTHKFKINRKTKRMNAYTFCGILVFAPRASERGQIIHSANTTAVGHLLTTMHSRYNEWHEKFSTDRV